MIMQEHLEVERMETKATKWRLRRGHIGKQLRRGGCTWWATLCYLFNNTKAICFHSLWASCLLSSLCNACSPWPFTKMSCVSADCTVLHSNIWFLRWTNSWDLLFILPKNILGFSPFMYLQQYWVLIQHGEL